MADTGFSYEDAIAPSPQGGFSFEDAVAPNSQPKPEPITQSPFASNRGVPNPDSATIEDIAKSSISGLKSAPFYAGDLGNTLVNSAGKIGGEAYTAMGGDLSPEQATALTNAKPFFSSNEIYDAVGSPLYEPKTGMGEAANFLSNMAGMSVAGEAGKLAGKAGDNAATSLARPSGDFPAAGIPDKFPGSSDTQKALFQSHTDALTHDNDLFNWRDQMAQGKEAQVPDLKATLTGVINDAKSQVANPQVESSAITKLNKINNKISDDGTAPLDALTDLDRYFNSLPKRAYTDSPINGIARGAVKTAIDKAAQTFPEFGDAHYAANDFHTNLKNEFENSVIDPIYNPDDTKNLDMYFRDKTRTPNAETQQRGENLMANVNSQGITGFNQVKSLLPNEAAQNAFTDEFLNYVKNKDGNGRMNALKSLISDPFTNTGRKIFDIAHPQYNADTKGFLSAENGEMPYDYGNDNTPFSSYMADSKKAIAEQKVFQKNGGYRSSNIPPKQLTYNPEPITMEGNTAGQIIPQTPSNKAVLGSSEQRPSGASISQSTDLSLYQDPISQGTPAENAAARQAGMSPSGYAAMRQQKLADEVANKENIRRRFEENEAWNQNKSMHEDDRQQAVNNVYDKMQDPSFDRMSPIQKADAVKYLIGDEMRRSQMLPESETETGLAMKNSGFKRGGSVQPTEAQKLAGNYKKDKVNLHGLPISIETKKGEVRSGKDKYGIEWKVKMPVSYGYIRGTEAKDGDHVDCFLGSNPKSLRVYVIDQKKDDGSYDEAKCMLGFKDRETAIKAYRDSFSDKKNRIMHVRKMLMPEFKYWIKNGNTKKPIKVAA